MPEPEHYHLMNDDGPRPLVFVCQDCGAVVANLELHAKLCPLHEARAKGEAPQVAQELRSALERGDPTEQGSGAHLVKHTPLSSPHRPTH